VARIVLPVVLMLGCAGGCAAIPESSDVQVLQQDRSGPVSSLVPAPPKGIEPLSAVRQFVIAGGKLADKHAAARAYLTPQAAGTWTDTGAVSVIDDTFNTVYETSPNDVPASDSVRNVEVHAHQLGRLDPNGVFLSTVTDVELRYTLVKQNGEWRISDPATGLLMQLSAFKTNYRSVGLAFLEPNRNLLVNDRRWVVSSPPSAIPGRVLDLLRAGPAPALRDSVTSELPPGARLRTNVVEGADGVLNVDLTGLQDPDDRVRRLIAAQVVSSLMDAPVGPVRLLSDGAALVADKPVWTVEDTVSYSTDTSVNPDLEPLVVIGGKVRGLRVGNILELRGIGNDPVRSAAESLNGDLLAVVTGDATERPRLFIGPPGALLPVGLQADTITRPTWRPAGDQAWVVIDGRTVVGVGRTNDPARPTVTFPIDAGALAALGPVTGITQLRLSRDGVSAAIVMNGRLMVASVVGSGTDVSLRSPRLLTEAHGQQVTGVDWIASDQLAVTTTSKDNPVARVSTDGLQWEGYEVANLSPPVTTVTASPNRAVLVTDQNGLWQSDTLSGVWASVSLAGVGAVGAPVVPFYPG
jgi:hypothetical protein